MVNGRISLNLGEYADCGQRRVDDVLEVIRNIFFIAVGYKCRHTATAGIRVERIRSAAVLVQQSIQYEPTSLTCTHLLLAGITTLSTSVWGGRGIRSTECRLV